MKAVLWLVVLTACATLNAQNLSITYGPEGLQQMSYRGVIISDVRRWPDDSFHIWHMKAYDRSGKVLSTGQYGWGENKLKRVWNTVDKSWTYTFEWGTIYAQYQQHGDVLDIVMTTANHSDSGVVMDGATIYPLVLHLQHVEGGSHVVDGTLEPGVVSLSWMDVKLVSVSPDAGKPIWSGFEAGKDGALALMASGTKPDSLGPGSDHAGLRVSPGESKTFALSLRFAENGASTIKVAADAFRRWSEQLPGGARWKDRRIIGTVFLASSPHGDKTVAGGFTMNPRRYFTDAGIDIRSQVGLQRFQARLLAQAETIVMNLKRMDAQGAVTWDIEGEEFPQDTSYVCAPDEIGRAAPEMESVLGAGSRYAGMELVDAYFKTIHDAGFRVGVCVRPQHFVLGTGGHARQHFLPEKEVAAELIRKMRYAHDRWGATLFYLDSTVREDGVTLDASVIEAAAAAMPDSLLIPEESSFRMYRATAPFMSFLFHGDLTTKPEVRAAYPEAFGVNLVNDVDASKLAEHRADFVQAVRQGDVMMVHAGYWQENNTTVMAIYHEAKRAHHD